MRADLNRRASLYEKQQLSKEKAIQERKFGGKNHRLGLNDQVFQFNFENQLYSGPIYVGSQQDELNLIFDSSSDWLMIEGVEC